MALSTQRASSSLAWAESPPRWKFDVFLSFRGEDTRRGFISHLYNQLQFWKVYKTFIDDQELEIGAEISLELFTAIENSHLAIVVLSPNYASSKWCLNELAKIVESMKAGDNRILPVFLDVDPSDIRHQRKSFAEAFAKHEEEFSNDPQKVKRWREALTKVANLSGWHAKNYKSERELIEVIVKRAWEKLRPTIRLSGSDEKLFGIEFRLGRMGSLLDLEKKDVRIIGIWGMGGVGKTTLAKLVFERISHHFEVAEFLFDVRKSHGQLVNLQKQILSPVLKENVSLVWDECKGTAFIRNCLSNKKVLLVLDDVDSCDLLEKLAGHISWFGEGSRIIVTTRDERVLTQHGIDLSFELLGLNFSEARELFSHKAFKKDQPKEGFLELSKCFVDYAKGLPLALVTLGSSLHQRNLDEWNSALDSLKRIPNPIILDTLKLSYDALDYWHREIFLDIAFFYKGMEKGHIIQLLQICYRFNSLIVINALIEKSLLTIDRYGNVGMHGLIQEMAEEIVRQEAKEPGFRSRLCDRDDIFHVFTRNTGTEAIKGVRLMLPKLEEADSNWNWDCFSNMHKLMFLEFDNLRISSGPKFLPNSLIIFIWNQYPSRSLPESFRPNLLAELKMEKSKLVQLWDGRQDLPYLKKINLSQSRNLKKTPDFTGIPNLEVLYLDDCEGLVEVHPSIAVLKKLKRLTLSRCKNLKSFPRKIEMDSLEYLNLSYCSKIKIPEFGEGMKNLSRLNMSRTATEELPASIEHLVGLDTLYMYGCKSLQILPGTAIFKLKSLGELDISGCPKLSTVSEYTEETKCLKPSIRRKLQSLLRKKSPEPLGLALPSTWALPSLRELQLSNCNLCQGFIPDDIGYCMPSLTLLNLIGNNFFTLPASIKRLSKLEYIFLSGCKRLQELPDLPSNSRLRVRANDCASLKKLSEPSQQGTFNNLKWFELGTKNCPGLIDKEGLNNGIFSMLRRLAAQGISSTNFESFNILSTGSKISEWFDIRSEGDSLTVELPPDRESYRSEWMGVLFCVVFAYEEEPDYVDFFINCLSPAGISLHSTGLGNVAHGDHLWVFFMPRSGIHDPTSCSFKFSLGDYRDNLYSNCVKRSGARNLYSNCVKRSGARLLYEQDLKDLLNTAATQMLKRSREDCDSAEAEAEAREAPSDNAGGSSNKESFFKRLKSMIA